MVLLPEIMMEKSYLSALRSEKEKLGQSVVELLTKKRGYCMKRKIIKSKPEYDKIEFDVKKSKEAQGKMNRKMPTSLTLPPETVEELKALAFKKAS